MTVATWLQPNNTTQDAASYKAAIDGGFAVIKRIGDAFAPHAQTVPNMTVALDAGAVFDGVTLTEIAAQSTGAITAPAANPRIDRVVVDVATGVVSVVGGVEAGSPVPPGIGGGKAPVAQVALIVGQASILNGNITDERLSGVVAPPGTPTGAMLDYCGLTAPAGFVLASGRTIGDATSGSTERANADTLQLFAKLWADFTDTTLPIQTSAGGASTRGGSAAADFAAHKRLTLPDLRGRVAAGKDDMGGATAGRVTNAGAGIVGTTLGAVGGAETQTLTAAQIPAHNHTGSFTGNALTAGVSDPGNGYNFGGGSTDFGSVTPTGSITINNSTGGGGAHLNTQPTFVVSKIIKL